MGNCADLLYPHQLVIAEQLCYHSFRKSKRTRHAAYNINYHLVFTEVSNPTIQPEHVHMFCSFPPTMASYQIKHRLKGYTAHVLREEFPHLNSRLPNLWTRSYYVGTAGSVSAATIQRYLDEQKRS